MSNPSFPKPAARRNPATRTTAPDSSRPQAAKDARPRPEGGSRPPAGKKREHSPESQDVPLLPGIKPVLELLETDPQRIDTVFLRKGRHTADMDRIIDLCRMNGVRFSLLDAQSFARVYAGKGQGVAARLYEAGFTPLETLLDGVMDAPLPLVLALDQVQDPGNAGTLARTLYALGGAGLIVPRHNGVYLGSAAARAGAGALERLPVAKAANLGQALDTAAKLGFTIYGSASRHPDAPDREGSGQAEVREPRIKDAVPLENVFSLVPRFPAVLALGSEEGGLRPGIEKRCHALVNIPMLREFDSINVAQAGAIITAWFLRQRMRQE